MFPPLPPTGDPLGVSTQGPGQDLPIVPPRPPDIVPTQMPMGPPPVMPRQVAQDPRQQLLSIAMLGAMLGAGRGSGIGAGLGHGTLAGQQQLQQLENQHAALVNHQQQQLAAAQQQAQDDADNRRKSLQSALMTISQRVEQIPDKATYDQEIKGYATALQGAGYRLDENWLRQAVPYVAPTAQKLATRALEAFQKNPANAELFKSHPEQLAKVSIAFDVDGDGIPEQVPVMRVAQIAGQPFATDDHGQLVSYPKGTTVEDKVNADGFYQDLLKQAKAEGKDVTDPAVTMPLRSQALDLANADKGKKTVSVGSFEDYVTRKFGPNPTARQIESARNSYKPDTSAPTVVIQTANGPQLLDKSKGTARAITDATGAPVEAPKPATVLAKEEDRKRASNGLDQLDKAIDEAAAFIGPGRGRISSIEQLVGNPNPKLSALATKMLMGKMTVDAGIGGARAAASPQLLARWDNLFSQNLTPENLHATVQAMREMIGGGSATATSPSDDALAQAAAILRKRNGR